MSRSKAVDLAEQAVSLLAVFGLLAAAVWAFGRRSGRSWSVFRRQAAARGCILVAGRLVLAPQHILHLIQIDGRTLLIATHPHGVTFEPAGAKFPDEFREAMSRPREQSS
jgi:flagellar biogenesis protein FliO